MDNNPDDPALQDECAERLSAYAAKRSAEITTNESNVFVVRLGEADNDNS